jgi:sporulation protein YlmC with PRC-barrel domain
MDLNTKGMQGVTVRTEGGLRVGKVASFDLDADTGRLRLIRVHTPGLVPRLLNDELLVPWVSVRSMTMEEVVINDATVAGTVRAIAQASG